MDYHEENPRTTKQRRKLNRRINRDFEDQVMTPEKRRARSRRNNLENDKSSRHQNEGI